MTIDKNKNKNKNYNKLKFSIEIKKIIVASKIKRKLI